LVTGLCGCWLVPWWYAQAPSLPELGEGPEGEGGGSEVARGSSAMKGSDEGIERMRMLQRHQEIEKEVGMTMRKRKSTL